MKDMFYMAIGIYKKLQSIKYSIKFVRLINIKLNPNQSIE